MSDDYGYINARIRAMKSFLLKKEDYLQASRQNTCDEFIFFLSRLPSYSLDMRQMLTNTYTPLAYEQALKLNLCRIFRKIFRFCEGEAKELVTILLRPWDIYNLKTIIRGILSQQSKDEISGALIPAGSWDLEFLKPLAQSKDLKLLARILEASAQDDCEREFVRLIRNYTPDTPLEVLEDGLTKVYFEQGCAYLREGNNNMRIVRDYLSLQIDLLNILLILRKIKSGFVKGGRLNATFLNDLLGLKSAEDTLKALGQSPYAWLSNEGLDLYKRTLGLSALEKLFKNKLFSFCYSLYIRGNPLSMGIPLAFINFKENEVRNLRLLGKAVNFGLPYHLIKEELIFAG